MRMLQLCQAMACLALWALSASGGGADKVDRRIAKEPAYRTKTPKYCLLVFGPEARTRVWLVLDGDTLYADLNGNGDLTEEGERFAASPAGYFKVESVTEKDGKTKHKLWLAPEGPPQYQVGMEINGKFDQFSRVAFADRPQDAPVCHFNGPLRVFLRPPEAPLYAGQESLIRIGIGTMPCDKQAGGVSVDCRTVPKDAHPVAELTFPGRQPMAKPITVRVLLSQRC